MGISFLVRPLFVAAALWPILLLSSAHAGEVNGVRVPEKVDTGACELVLNGTALRSVWGFKVYLAGLYLTKPCESGHQIMNKDREGKRVHITMLREVSASKFGSTIRECIDANFSGREKREFATELKSFLSCFGGGSALRKGSVVNIDFVPEMGTKVRVDSREFALIPGDNFYHALLRLWIGKPLQESMKLGLLGKGA